MRSLTLGLGASLLAFACSSSDKNAPADEAPPPTTVTQPPVDNTVKPVDPGQTAPPPVKPPPAAQGLGELGKAAFEELLLENCGECHGPNSKDPQAGMNYINDIDQLVANGKIIPGKPLDSKLYQRVSQGSMPPAPRDKLDADVLKQIETYITKLAPPAVASCTNQFKSFDDVYGEIQGDIFQQDADDRQFTRYVTIVNRYNQGVCKPQLEDDIGAMNKAINSLSDQSRVIQAEAIDPEETIFRIDLRDFGWDQPTSVAGIAFADKWEALIAASVYAVEFQGDEADAIKLQALTTVPVIYSDALIEVGPVADLYYAFINVGDTRDQLLADLEIDQVQQDDQKITMRAGNSNSALSNQPVVAIRNDIEAFNGAYWERFDFADATDDQSIFANPLDFAADGSEVVFSLANGLNGYVIFDAAGVRQNDSNILFDQKQNDLKVRVMTSCGECHAAGFNNMTDEVRGYVEENFLDFDNATFETVQDLYPSAKDLLDQIKSDKDSYSLALSRAGVQANGSDPMNDVFVRFDADVQLAVAAGDLGIKPDQFERALDRLAVDVDPTYNTLRGSGRLDRDDFENIYVAGLCVLQQNADNQPLAAACDAVGQ